MAVGMVQLGGSKRVWSGSRSQAPTDLQDVHPRLVRIVEGSES